MATVCPICPICQDDIKQSEQVNTTCSAMHTFCFSCILKTTEHEKCLKPCPVCRGNNKFIMISRIDNTNVQTYDFYSLSFFKTCSPILNKVFNLELDNSCLINEKMLLLYILNKKQLLFVHKIREYVDISEIIEVVKWKEKPQNLNGNQWNSGTIPVGSFGTLDYEFPAEFLSSFSSIFGPGPRTGAPRRV